MRDRLGAGRGNAKCWCSHSGHVLAAVGAGGEETQVQLGVALAEVGEQAARALEYLALEYLNVWMAWLDWAVRFVRPSWEANVTTWNLGPLGYEYYRTQLQQLLKEGQAVVMVQEVRFPLGARQRVN